MNIIDVIKSGDYLILDTETTGLGVDAEICQIAIINSKGETLLDTLVKPVKPIPADATAIHGITNEQVKDCMGFSLLESKIYNLLKNRHVIIYNRDYDVQMLNQSNRQGRYPDDWNKVATYWCAMKHFAEIYGDYNSYYKTYRWKSLSVACQHYGIEVPKDAHSALADCKSTLAVCKAMAGIT